jgi:hypothetical protein
MKITIAIALVLASGIFLVVSSGLDPARGEDSNGAVIGGAVASQYPYGHKQITQSGGTKADKTSTVNNSKNNIYRMGGGGGGKSAVNARVRYGGFGGGGFRRR